MADHRDLPEELLLNILWRLKLSTGSHNAARDENHVLAETLFSCMLASRTLHRLWKPVLYHTINHRDLFRIAQHLAHDPTLADHVRELSAHERSCHESVRVMGEDDDRQWPEYLRDRMSAFRCCFVNPHSPDDISTRGLDMPIATFALLVCTNIHTLVMHSIFHGPPALVEHFIKNCISVDPNKTHISLARLRKFDLRYPPLPRELEGDEDLRASFERQNPD